jgi:hypothetical protein
MKTSETLYEQSLNKRLRSSPTQLKICPLFLEAYGKDTSLFSPENEFRPIGLRPF